MNAELVGISAKLVGISAKLHKNTLRNVTVNTGTVILINGQLCTDLIDG